MSTAELDRFAAARLRHDGQRYTENRRELVHALAAVGGPCSIPEILRANARLAQSSVYRNLGVLERAGVVRRIVTSDDWARYELTEDITGHHHHLICRSCGSVTDFRLSPQLERSLDQALGRAADRAGFSVDHHQLDLIGTCTDCG